MGSAAVAAASTMGAGRGATVGVGGRSEGCRVGRGADRAPAGALEAVRNPRRCLLGQAQQRTGRSCKFRATISGLLHLFHTPIRMVMLWQGEGG